MMMTKDQLNSNNTATMPDICNNSDVMSCIDDFMGKRCLVALRCSTRQNPNEVYDGEHAHDVAVNEEERNHETRLCCIQISTSLKHITAEGSMILEQTVSVKEPFGMMVKYHKGKPLIANDNGGCTASIEYDNADNKEFVRYNNNGTSAGKSTNESKTAKLAEPAFGLTVVGTSVCIGFTSSIGWVDFSSPDPVCQVLLRNIFLSNRGRCYDRFLMHGQKLIVIGNVSATNYADVFDISDNNESATGVPLYVENWTLPASYSSQYMFVGMTDDDLFIMYDIAWTRENSQSIIREPLSGFSRSRRRKRDWDQARESISSRTVGTLWRDFAIQRTAQADSSQVLIAAGKNGLLSLPAKFQRNAAPTKIPLSSCESDSVSGVSTFEGEIWTLINGPSVDSKSWIMKVNSNTKIPLPGQFDRLL